MSQFTETQIIAILKEGETGSKVKDICRAHGISDATYYNWKSKYGGMQASDLKRMKDLEHELSQFKRMYADMALENRALKGLALTPSCRREAVLFLVTEHKLSISRGCSCMGISRTAYSRLPQIRSDEDVINALNELIAKHPRWGFWKCFHALRRTHSWNHKKVYHVYCDLRLNQKRRANKRLPKRIK